ncbi:hypothetical protein [Nocardia cyriacigeorgica]|nr:hypothetical protein [Nocardia cyriacigeorgica]
MDTPTPISQPTPAGPDSDGDSPVSVAMTDVATLRQVLDGLTRKTDDEGRRR